MAGSVSASDAEVSTLKNFYTRPKRSNALSDAFPWDLRDLACLKVPDGKST